MSTGRIEINTDERIKSILEKAATVSGMALSSFIINYALPQAKRVLEEDKTFKLSLKDSEYFLNALDNPPKPNDALLKLMQ